MKRADREQADNNNRADGDGLTSIHDFFSTMEKSIRVRILGRDYPLIVQEEDERLTREIAAHVDAKMQAFKKAHPEQSEVTTAVVTALALAEEVFTLTDQREASLQALNHELDALDRQLAAVLPDGESQRSS